MRALVLAVDPGQLAAIGMALESVGLMVELLADAAAARRRLTSSMPDLVVMDARGPQLPLFEVYETLRESPVGATVPVIFARYTAQAIDHDGPDHYLPASSDTAAIAALAGELLGLPKSGDIGPAVSAADRPAPAVPPRQPAAGGVGRVLELLLLMVGIVLLLIGGAIVLLRRDTLPPLVVPPTVVPATAIPRASPVPAFGVLPAPSPSPTP